MTLTHPLAALGRQVLSALAAIGRIALFGASAVTHAFRPPFYPREFLHALLQIGYFSLPVVGLTTLFTGGAPDPEARGSGDCVKSTLEGRMFGAFTG